MAKTTLTDLQRELLQQRYIPLLRHLHRRTWRISFFFHSSRTIVTVGSLIVPALLSIQYSHGMEQTLQVYWVAWVLSLFVTICNGLLTLFKLDKRYFFLHTVKEQMISEGWQYLELSGRFSGFYTPGQDPTHENQFMYFCHTVEKLRMRQIQEEYYNLNETSKNSSASNTSSIVQVVPSNLPAPPRRASQSHMNTIIDSLIPPTPLKAQLTKLANLYPNVLTGDGATAPRGAHTEATKEKADENRANESVPVPGQL